MLRECTQPFYTLFLTLPIGFSDYSRLDHLQKVAYHCSGWLLRCSVADRLGLPICVHVGFGGTGGAQPHLVTDLPGGVRDVRLSRVCTTT